MTVINRSALVSYTSSEMYNLVNDIESYPDFLPWCKESYIHSRTEHEVHASLVLARGSLQRSFSTVNRLQKDKMIQLHLVDGPFKRLEGCWRFEPNEIGCRISLDMEFEFSNKLIGLAFGPLFTQVTDSLVDAFCQHAQSLYGKR